MRLFHPHISMDPGKLRNSILTHGSVLDRQQWSPRTTAAAGLNGASSASCAMTRAAVIAALKERLADLEHVLEFDDPNCNDVARDALQADMDLFLQRVYTVGEVSPPAPPPPFPLQFVD